jgi:hypothetical protein
VDGKGVEVPTESGQKVAWLAVVIKFQKDYEKDLFWRCILGVLGFLRALPDADP